MAERRVAVGSASEQATAFRGSKSPLGLEAEIATKS